MKRLFVALVAFATLVTLVAAGFGCAEKQNVVPVDPNLTVYENAQYGFSFAYPSTMEVRVRPEEDRATKYLGMDADFFASLRDTVRDTKPTNIAWFYAASGLTVEAFTSALIASNASGAVQVKSTEDVTVNGLDMKKITSTTEMGTDKTHYLIDRGGTLIIVSIYLAEEPAWDPVLATMREL